MTRFLIPILVASAFLASQAATGADPMDVYDFRWKGFKEEYEARVASPLFLKR